MERLTHHAERDDYDPCLRRWWRIGHAKTVLQREQSARGRALRTMRKTLPAISLVVVLLLLTLNAFGADRFIGWRGDGTGKYPDANPPLAWSRVSAAVAALRFSAV